MEETKKTLAIVSFVLAIVGLLLNCFSIGWAFGIAALIIGIISRKKNEGLKGLAIAAIVVGAIDTLWGLAAMVIGFLWGAAAIGTGLLGTLLNY